MIKNFTISELQSKGQWESNFHPDARKKEIDIYLWEPWGQELGQNVAVLGSHLVQQAAGKMRRVWEAWLEHGWHASLCQGGVWEILQMSDVGIQKLS